MNLLKYKSKVDRITQSVRNLAVRHNFYFQIIGSFNSGLINISAFYAATFNRYKPYPS